MHFRLSVILYFSGGTGGVVKGRGHGQQRAAGELRPHLEPARPLLQRLLQGQVQARVVAHLSVRVRRTCWKLFLRNQKTDLTAYRVDILGYQQRVYVSLCKNYVSNKDTTFNFTSLTITGESLEWSSVRGNRTHTIRHHSDAPKVLESFLSTATKQKEAGMHSLSTCHMFSK